MTLQQIRKSVLALPLRSRRKLMIDLQSSLGEASVHRCPSGVLSDQDPNFEKIIQGRLDRYDRGEDKGIPWEEVRAKMDAKINARKTPKRRGTRTR
jgi:hypothetical protein